MELHGERRKIFPALVDDFEHRLLQQLSTEDGVSMSAMVRKLIMEEEFRRRYATSKDAPQMELKP